MLTEVLSEKKLSNSNYDAIVVVEKNLLESASDKVTLVGGVFYWNIKGHYPKKCVSLKIIGFDFLLKVEPFFQI